MFEVCVGTNLGASRLVLARGGADSGPGRSPRERQEGLTNATTTLRVVWSRCRRCEASFRRPLALTPGP